MKDTKSNYRVDDVIDYLVNQDGARKLLSKLGIQVTQKDFEISEFERNFEHQRLILKDAAMVNAAPVDVAIDVKLGQPTTDQVCELMYGYGRDCGIRILFFNNYNFMLDEGNLSADEIVVESLVGAMNQYPVRIYLIRIMENNNMGGFNFETVRFPEDDPIYDVDELLTLEKFKESEFWRVYYYGVDNIYKDNIDVFSAGIHNRNQFEQITEGGDWEVHLIWNDDGVTFSAIIPIENLNEATKMFLGDNGESGDMYRDFEKSISITPEKKVQIVVRAWEFPLSRLYVADCIEKKGYGLLIKAGFWKFTEIIEGLFETK